MRFKEDLRGQQCCSCPLCGFPCEWHDRLCCRSHFNSSYRRWGCCSHAVSCDGFHVSKVFSSLAALVGLAPHMGSFLVPFRFFLVLVIFVTGFACSSMTKQYIQPLSFKMFTDTHVTIVETSHIQPHVIHEHICSAHIQTHTELAPRANRANRATRTLLREQIEQRRPRSATARCNDDLAPRNRGTPAGKAIKL